MILHSIPPKHELEKELIDWLNSLYKHVQARLRATQQDRAELTLLWVPGISEFKRWETSSISGERELWILGAPGVGKSTIAGYIVDHLRYVHKDAVLAYFFCSETLPRLRSPFGIIRTLAHQIVEQDAAALSVLKKLWKKDPEIDESLGVDDVFERLLENPLENITRDVYIILDGLDELDDKKMDVMKPRQSEVSVFIECLRRLPKARLLCLSRSYRLMNVRGLSNPLLKTIEPADNMKDILTFVKKKLKESTYLKNEFAKAGLDPMDYFNKKSSGIFLWAAIAVSELSRPIVAKHESSFNNRLKRLSNALGDMKKLWSSVLNKVLGDEGDEEDEESKEKKEYISEILRWLLVARRELDVDDLKIAIEISYGNCWEKDDFITFLNIPCSPFLRYLHLSKGRIVVQLIHETFRSALIESEEKLKINAPAANIQVALTCLDLLSLREEREYGSSSLLHYAARYWPLHFVEARMNGQSDFKLLKSVRDFLKSDSHLATWLEISFDFDREMGNPDEVLASIVAMTENVYLPPDQEISGNYYFHIFKEITDAQ